MRSKLNDPMQLARPHRSRSRATSAMEPAGMGPGLVSMVPDRGPGMRTATRTQAILATLRSDRCLCTRGRRASVQVVRNSDLHELHVHILNHENSSLQQFC
jgi:hypothetical protein